MNRFERGLLFMLMGSIAWQQVDGIADGRMEGSVWVAVSICYGYGLMAWAGVDWARRYGNRWREAWKEWRESR